VVIALLALLSCGAPTQATDTVPRMDDLRLLSRISLDLRGVRPTADEIAAIEAAPTALDDLIEDYLADERFGERVRQIFAEIYLTRADTFGITAADFGLDDESAFAAAVGDEPLRVVSEIAQEDLPWTDVVTADWTMANEVLAAAWTTDYPAGGSGWQQVRYTDGRPSAGVLSTTGLWLRYTSTDSNANRTRANAISRILLCHDYLTRPLEFDREVDLLDEAAISAALTENPSCVNCHVSLDPLAGYLFGFWAYQSDSWLEVSRYHPERERLWSDYLDVAPGYYGQSGESLGDLGRQIAADPRLSSCAVEQVTGALLQRDITADDAATLLTHREAFLGGDMTLRALIRSVVSDPLYTAGQTDHPGAAPSKLLSPPQLATAIEDLTGFRWTYGGYDMMGTDLVGVRTLAGGADGITVTRTTTTPNATMVLVSARLAEAAASHAVASEAALAQGERRLFTELSLGEDAQTPSSDPDAVAAQVAALHLAVFGQRVTVDGEEVAAGVELLETLLAMGQSPAEAWSALLSALLRDPDFLIY